MGDFPGNAAPLPEIDTSRPHPARIYDYGLGCENHFPADREVAEKVLASMPTARTVARENRKFLGRAIRFLAGEVGIRQFLGIGSGMPTTENVHEVTLLGALSPGSYLAATHTTAEHDPEGWASVARAYTAANIQGQVRDSGEFARLAFSSLDLVPPGVVLVSEWRPDDEGPRAAAAEVSCYGGVARKP